MTEPRLTAAEVADHLGINIRRVYNLNAADNDFPTPVYIGRTPTWDAAELDTWRATHPSRRGAANSGASRLRPKDGLHPHPEGQSTGQDQR